MTGEQIASLEPRLLSMAARFQRYFKRDKTFVYLVKYMVGLLSNVKRKSIEPIALAAGVAVRTLQEFLAFFVWDEARVAEEHARWVAEDYGREGSIGVLDGSAHFKQGTKTPGVQRQWCGEKGKTDNCVLGYHLLYTDNHPTNPFSCVVASDLYLPKSWAEDRERCRTAGIPEDLDYRPGWRIGIDQIRGAMGNGLRFSWITFDEEVGSVPEFWSELDALGQRAVGEVKPHFRGWVTRPRYTSVRSEWASHRVDDLVAHSPAFTKQTWRSVTIKDVTRGPTVWKIKVAPFYRAILNDEEVSVPMDRAYWLIVARHPVTGEVKYFVSTAPLTADVDELLRVAFARWHVEKWFERAKQEAGFGAFEVRTYPSLIRHWLISRLAMFFLSRETHRLREKKSADHVGAGGRSHPSLGGKDLEPVLDGLESPDREVRVLAMA